MNARVVAGGIVVFAIIVAAYAVIRNDARQAPHILEEATATPAEKNYDNPAYGLSFSYPAAYQLTERDVEGSGERVHHAIVLIHENATPLPENGEGPPAITIDAYQNNLDKQTTEDWIKNDSRSNFKLSEGTLSETLIGGFPALSYRWSGLYDGTTIAIARPDWVYAFSVTYLEVGADIIQDFVKVRDSVRLSNID